MIFQIYIIGAIITFAMFAYAETQLDDGLPWFIGAIAVALATLLWPLAWIGVSVLAVFESENEDEQKP